MQVYFNAVGGEHVNYYEIGQRIRKIRKARGLSQEQLAEAVGISVTHMSHIETANTKLSLPVFIEIAKVLEVRADELIYEQPRSCVSTATDEILEIMKGCDGKQALIIRDIIKATKQALEANL